MKLQILQENLSKAINTASRFTSSRSQLPILGNILLSAQKTKILICSTNLEISVSIAVGAKVEEVGEVSVPSKVVNEVVGNLPKETLELSSEKEQLQISAPNFSSSILGINSSDFPKIPNAIARDKAVPISRDVLVKSLSQVIFAASVDETRPVLTGVLFVWGKDGLNLVATDGFRLSQKKIKIEAKEILPQFVLPKMILSEISRTDQSVDSQMFLETRDKDKQVVFGIGDTILSSRLLEGEYPEFEKIIPKKSTYKVLVDKDEFLRTVKLASVFARDNANIVKIKLLKDALKITAESSSSGSQETKVDAKIEGEGSLNLEVAFNYKFLEDFLHSVNGEEVEIGFSGENSPGLFTDTSDPSYLHLIMPVRLQS